MDLIIRKSSDLEAKGDAKRAYKLQLRDYPTFTPPDYYHVAYLSEEKAIAVAEAGAPSFLLDSEDPRKVKP